MKRLPFVLFAFVLLSLSTAYGVPARPLYEPPPPPKMPALIQLPGTTWIGRLYTDNEQVTFHADGTLTYGATVKGAGSPGSWRLVGNQLYFQINNWSEYETIVEGDMIRGNGWNKSGQKCQPMLKRSYNGQQEKAQW